MPLGNLYNIHLFLLLRLKVTPTLVLPAAILSNVTESIGVQSAMILSVQRLQCLPNPPEYKSKPPLIEVYGGVVGQKCDLHMVDAVAGNKPI